jgi:cation:H+ antiporter
MSDWLHDLLRLAAGVLFAWGGGELFVRGLQGVAVWTRIPPRIIGVTLAAFATSTPEIFVALTAAHSGVPAISAGDLTGSNVVNVGLILAGALLFAPLEAVWRSVARDYLAALAVPLIILVLLHDGLLSRVDGFVLMGLFAVWLLAVLREGFQERGPVPAQETPTVAPVLYALAGLAVLMAAGHFIVEGGRGIAARCGMSDFLVGATVVAVATGTPELATTIVARLKGHHDIGLGNILGSNIFNGLFILSLVALVAPFPLSAATVAPALAAGFLTTLACLPLHGRITRAQGWLLLALYAVYLVVILQTRGAPHPAP